MALDDSSARIETHDPTMGRRARVVDVDATELVLVRADASDRPQPDTAAGTDRSGHAGHLGPVRVGRVEIETLVQVHPDAESRLVDRRRSAGTTRRRTGPSSGSVLANSNLTVGLRTLARVERDARPRGTRRRSACPMRSTPSASHAAIWASFASWAGCGRRCGPVRRFDGVNGTSRTQSDTDDFATPSSVAMSCSVMFRARMLPRPFLLLDLPAVAHAATVRRGCDTEARYVPPMGRDGTVGVGVIGRGFGQTVVAPVFDETEGCTLVDVVSPRDDGAVRALCERPDVDLVAVHAPPFLHPRVRHVPHSMPARRCSATSRSAPRSPTPRRWSRGRRRRRRGRAPQLRVPPPPRTDRAALADPGRRRSGTVEHIQWTVFGAGFRVPLRPYGWLFDRERGGGWIGAWGSHVIDFLRWTFGDLVDASARLRTDITERPDADGARAPVHRRGRVHRAALDRAPACRSPSTPPSWR